MDKFEQVMNLIRAFNEIYPDAGYRFAHIVIDDYNLDDDWIDSCLKHYEQWGEQEIRIWGNKQEIDLPTYEFLKLLRLLPEEWRTEPGE